MNRDAIASVERDPVTMEWCWNPTSRFVALGLRPVRLGQASHTFRPEFLGDERFAYEDKAEAERDQSIRDRIVVLNRAARSIRKADKEARKLARLTAQQRSPDR